MSSLTKKQPKSKPELRIDYSRADDGMPVHVSITAPGCSQSSDYWCEVIPSTDYGFGLRFKKVWNGKTRDFDFVEYDVNLDLTSWIHSCECPHFLKTGKTCRHIKAGLLLLDEGALSVAPRPVVERREPECVEESPAAYCSLCGCEQSIHGGEGNEFCPI